MRKKIVALSMAVLMLAVAVIGGTLAYFTDKDQAENVFTVGGVDITLNEVFDKDTAKLMPGINVNKDVSIKLAEGSEDAYVWYLWKIPADLDSIDGTTGTNNALHVNSLGRTWDTYCGNSKYWAEDQTAALPVEQTWDHDPEVELGTQAGPEGYLYTETINGVEYHVYAALYHGVLSNAQGGQTETTQAMDKVYLDKSVNKDGQGYYQIINKGPEAGQKHYLPSLPDNAKIIVEAYAIQAAGFDDVYAAYSAYQTQK